jgi:hypothetical protein
VNYEKKNEISRVNIDNEERDLIDSVESGEWKSTTNIDD